MLQSPNTLVSDRHNSTLYEYERYIKRQQVSTFFAGSLIDLYQKWDVSKEVNQCLEKLRHAIKIR